MEEIEKRELEKDKGGKKKGKIRGKKTFLKKKHENIMAGIISYKPLIDVFNEKF